MFDGDLYEFCIIFNLIVKVGIANQEYYNEKNEI